MTKKIDGYVCDRSQCRKFFKSDDPITGHGKLRTLHFCSLLCKSEWVKTKNLNEEKDVRI